MKDKEVKQEGFWKAFAIVLFIAVVLLGVVLLGLFVSEDMNVKSGSDNNVVTQEGENSYGEDQNSNRYVKGNSNAQLLIVEYSDFECPFCQRFYSETYGQIVENYVDTGQVKFVYKHFPLTRSHPNAFNAALAYECAVEQKKGSDYHDGLFEGASMNVVGLKALALELELDSNQFDNCLDSKKYEQRVLDDMKEASELGVTGTPTLFIGETKIVGAQPFSVIKREIDKQLEELQ